jgi:hypothetical protein
MRLYTPSGETPAGMAHRSIGAAEEAIVAGKRSAGQSVGWSISLVIDVKKNARALSLSLERSSFGCLLSDYRYAGE